MTVAALTVLALPAGAQPASCVGVRHPGDGFSVDLPAAGPTEGSRPNGREVRRIAGDDPELAGIIDNMLAAGSGNVSLKLIAFDLAQSSLKTGFATSLNVVRERTSLPLAAWRQEALKALNSMSFVLEPIWWQNVKLPAGKAVRFTYRALQRRREAAGRPSITQYAFLGQRSRGRAHLHDGAKAGQGLPRDVRAQQKASAFASRPDSLGGGELEEGTPKLRLAGLEPVHHVRVELAACWPMISSRLRSASRLSCTAYRTSSRGACRRRRRSARISRSPRPLSPSG